jgi:hypothetical protein
MFRPIWPSSGVKCFIATGETAALVVAVVIYFPQMHTYVCNTYEISLGFCVCAVFFVRRVVTYFVYSMWLLCLLSSADLAACPSLNASLSWTGPSFYNVFFVAICCLFLVSSRI